MRDKLKRKGFVKNSRMITYLRFEIIRPFGSLYSNLLPRGFLLDIHFFFGDGFVWDRALPATDFVLAPVRPSFKREDALLATAFEVCLLLLLAICYHLLSRHSCIITTPLATAILDRLLHHAHVVNIRGQSYGMKSRIKAGTNAIPQQLPGDLTNGVVNS